MKRALGPVLAVLCMVVTIAPQEISPNSGSADNGIFVGLPKVFDDKSLQALLNVARGRLSQINAFDQGSLISHLGAVQGASITQTQLSFQANGLPLAGVTTTANNAAPNTVTTVDNTTSQKAGATAPDKTSDSKTVTSGPTGSLQTQVTSPQVTPASASLPSLPSFTLPPSFSVSSLDILNEQLQVSNEIINLQLLLEGSASDLGRPRVTFGFPISISVPRGDKYRNTVAEVEVSVCNPNEFTGDEAPSQPSLITILPREKTYNVANIVNKSLSIGGGAILGVINVAGGFLHSRQTYYLAKDQDTVAIQRSSMYKCTYTIKDKSIEIPAATFAWQFRPVLGQKVVLGGLRQTFAQIAFVRGTSSGSPVKGVVHRGWKRYDAKTGRVGEWVDAPAEQTFEAKTFDATPMVRALQVDDNGDGTVTVRAQGTFAAGTRVRIANVVQDESTPGFEHSDNNIKFTVVAQLVALQEVKLVSRDGAEGSLSSPVSPSVAGANSPSPAGAAVGTGSPSPSPAAEIKPFTDSSSLVTLRFDPPLPPVPSPRTDGVKGPTDLGVAVIGTKVFGLRDAPFQERQPDHVTFLAPTDLLRAATQISWKKLFSTDSPRVFLVPAGSNFSITSIALVSASESANIYVISGSALDALSVLVPTVDKDRLKIQSGNTAAILTLNKDQFTGLKNIVLQHGSDAPIVLALPTGAPPDNKPSLDKQKVPLNVGQNKLTVTGNSLDTVVDVHYLEKPLTFLLASDKKSLVVQLPNDLTAIPGIQVLEFVYSDKTSVRYEVPITGK